MFCETCSIFKFLDKASREFDNLAFNEDTNSQVLSNESSAAADETSFSQIKTEVLNSGEKYVLIFIIIPLL